MARAYFFVAGWLEQQQGVIHTTTVAEAIHSTARARTKLISMQYRSTGVCVGFRLHCIAVQKCGGNRRLVNKRGKTAAAPRGWVTLHNSTTPSSSTSPKLLFEPLAEVM